MALPGWSNVAGVGAGLLYRFLDPRRKKEKLLEERERILAKSQTDKLTRRLEWVNNELIRVQRDIDRRAD